MTYAQTSRMATSDFFARLGIFTFKGFLDPQFCANYLTEANLVTATPALVLPKSGDIILEAQVCQSQRRTEQLKISTLTESFIHKRLLAIKPTLESYFGLPLSGFQKPLFYRYKKGSFFGAHQDSSDRPDAPNFIKERRVSIILFLNSKAVEPSPLTYCGGNLTFYKLIDDPRWETYGFPIESEAGMLVAFRSDIWHEVKPVTDGERYTIVSWFF